MSAGQLSADSPAAAVAPTPAVQQAPEPSEAVRLLDAITAVGRWAVTETDPIALMKRATLLAAKILGTDHLGIAELTSTGECSIFQFSSTEKYEQSIPLEKVRLASGTHQSLCIHAISQADPVFVANLDGQGGYDDRYLRNQGIVRALVAPLRDMHLSYGLMGVFTTQDRSFSKSEVAFFESIAHLVTTIIARNRALISYARQKKFSESLVDSTEALLLMLTPEERISGYNRALKDLSGFELSEINNRHFTNVFAIPMDVPVFKQKLGELRDGTDPVRFESSLLTKHGEPRRVSWSFTAIRGTHEQLESIIGTAIDITDKCNALERLEVAEATAEAVKQSLQALQEEVRNGNVEHVEDILTKILVGDEADSGEREDGSDKRSRRTHIRCPFRHKQQCALVIDGKLPGHDDFFEVVCNDISAGGISMLMDQRPPTDDLIVVLGAEPSLTYMQVAIRNVRKSQHEGREKFLVGCSYEQRVELPPTESESRADASE